MNSFILSFACFTVTVVGAGCAVADEVEQSNANNNNSRPNIVFFITDDYGWQDTSEPMWTERTKFNDRFRTPSMQKLARRGVKYTTGYTSCSVCAASRISILTGQHPVRHGTTFITGSDVSRACARPL